MNEVALTVAGGVVAALISGVVTWLAARIQSRGSIEALRLQLQQEKEQAEQNRDRALAQREADRDRALAEKEAKVATSMTVFQGKLMEEISKLHKQLHDQQILTGQQAQLLADVKSEAAALRAHKEVCDKEVSDLREKVDGLKAELEEMRYVARLSSLVEPPPPGGL